MGKYDFDLDLVHSDSALKILEQIKTNSVILEFGPANGRMTKYMKETLHCEVYLAELDAEAGREALQYGADLVIGDIENYEWYAKYRDVRFDYILFADVLEHLRDPLKVLIHAKMLLKVDGSILLSVPNFAHNAIVINLLNNQFEYRDIGLLDNTHIHMFTKNSLEKMLVDADLYPVKKMATYVKTEETEIAVNADSVAGLNRSFWKNRPYGEVYQYVYEVKKNTEWSENLKYELKCTLSGDAIKVYRDNGKGYDEDCTIIQQVYDYSIENKVFFVADQNEKLIRVDPMEQSGIMKLVTCEGVAGDKRISLPVLTHNASLVRDDIYFFETMDPQWQIEIPKNTGIMNIEVVVSYIALLDSKTVHIIVENLEKSDEERIRKFAEERCRTQQEEFEKKNQQIQKRFDEMRGTAEECLNQIREYHDKENELTKRLLEKDEILDDLRSQADSSRQTVDDLQNQLTLSRQTVDDLQNQLTLSRQTVDDLQNQLTSSRQTVSDLQNQVNLSYCRADELQEQLNELQELISQSRQHIKDLEDTLDQKDSVIQDIYNSNTWKWNRRINRMLGRKI